MKKLLQGLNPDQRLAVETTEGPVLVLAGAGSGKTRVITVRMAHLLQKRVAPEHVLAMTFTNKAAAEMRERVAGIVGTKRAGELTVGTFHSFCARSLRAHAVAAGLPRGFTICDASDQLTAARGVLRELRIAEATIQPRALLARISLLKNQLVTPEEFLERPGDDRDELVGRAFGRYQEHLRRAGVLDFDDLLLRMLELLRTHRALRKAFRERYCYVMVDEYQDTNGPQYEIVREIAGKHRNLCVVGDDDQSIYGWRGADVSKILNFERDFTGATVVRLEINYRSTVEILEAANRLIANNPKRHDKQLRSHKGAGEPVTVVQLEDESAEASWVVRSIIEERDDEKFRLGEVVILLRTAVQARAFEAELRARNLPYVLVGGMSFFDRKEVRDLIAYLRLLLNPDDETAFLRVLNCPPRGIGKTSLDRALAFATAEGISITQAFRRWQEIEKLPEVAAASVALLRDKLEGLSKHRDRDLVALVRRLVESVDYRAEVDRCYPDPKVAEDRWGAVGEILNFAENYQRRRGARAALAGFLEELALSATDEQSSDEPGRRDAVTLMTLHASKGLEFPRVFLAGFEEGLLPHTRSAAEDSVEEERRLAYVGITRAQDVLTLSHARERARHGSRALSHPSRFLFELKGQIPPAGWLGVGADPGPRPGGRAPGKKKASRRRVRKGLERSGR